MEDPDRLEAAHVRHEDIDDHQIDARIVESDKTIGAATGDRARDLTNSESLPLTQEILAQMIGVQRNAVSIVAHALQQAGVIRYSREHIEITSLDDLRKTSCECYKAVKTQHDRLLRPFG